MVHAAKEYKQQEVADTLPHETFKGGLQAANQKAISITF